MQVQHEACLIEPSLPNFAEHPSKSLDSYCLLPQLSNSLSPIEQIAACPAGSSSSSSLLAVHLNANNQIVILDTQSHQRRDKFPLKAYDKKFSRQSFHVSGLAFSLDGQRLAVGQTDCIIYIYKLALAGQTGGSDATGPTQQVAKTTISGKFASSSPVTCLIWTELGLVFGGQDGKVRLILSFNKPPPPTPQSAAATTSDPNSKTSGQTQEQKQASPPKFVTLFAGGKGEATPICLAYKAPVLLVGLSNCTLQVLVISANSGTADGEQVGGLSDLINTSSDLLSLLPPAPSSRRNSSSVAISSQAPVVVQSHTIEHSCPPVHMNLIHLQHSLVACYSGSDGKIAFHSLKAKPVSGGGSGSGSGKGLAITSQLEQIIDLKEDILAMDYSHVNEILALATKSRLMFVRYDQQQDTTDSADLQGAQPWRLQASTIELRRVLSLTSIRWTRDGAQLALGCSSGSLELFKCQWSKQSMNDKVDICHIARNRIRITDRERNLLATYKTLYDIKRVNLLDGGRSVLVWTSNSLLLAKLGGPQSEINWPARDLPARTSIGSVATGSKFLFDQYSDYVIIYNEASRELRLLKLGQDNVRFTVQLPASSEITTLKRRLLSVCQFPLAAGGNGSVRKLSMPPTDSSRQGSAAQPPGVSTSSGPNFDVTVNALQFLEETGEQLASHQVAAHQVERFAYLSSHCQLEIIDLSDKQLIHSHGHAHQIEWLTFGHTGRLLAFLDASGQLNLLRIKQQVADDNLLEFDSNQGPGDDRPSGDLTSSNDTVFDSEVLLTNCNLDCPILWLPESDSLVAQAGAIVYIWHDLYDCGPQVVEKFDTRNYNFMRKPPIIDLSLRAGAQAEAECPKIKALIFGDRHQPDGEDELAIELSNDQRIQLDTISAQFYAKFASGSLESALELLDKLATAASGRGHTRLYAKLGWMAIERTQCELAWKIFRKLQYKSLAKYLEQCVATAANDTATGGHHRAALMLAKLRGDWNKFERLLAHDLEEVIATYRRLNKWTRLVEFLGRKQQFRQRDLAERDQISWLIGRDRLREAAKLEASSSGDLVGALELLLGSHRGPHEACEFALRNEQKMSLALDGRPRLRELLETDIRDNLVASGDPLSLCKAAAVCDKILGDFRRALDLCLAAGNFESALQVAESARSGDELSDRVDEIHLLCADDLREKFLADRYRTSGKRARAAIGHYLACNQIARALEMANLLRATGRGYEILRHHWDELNRLKEDRDGEQRNAILTHCGELARQLLAAGEYAQATRALEMAGNYERLIEMLIEQGELQRAFQVSLEHLHAGDRQATRASFVELAGSYVTEAGKGTELQANKLYKRAERIYLLVDQVQLAVEMHESVGHYDRMLELIERYQTADQLEASLLQLARSLELAGKLEEAEKYLLRASPGEWTSVVRMYRLARRWPDAFRVARANCLSERDPLLAQLAYWWAKSLIPVAPSGGGDAQNQLVNSFAQARELLHELKLYKQVLEFACEAKNFQFALAVCGDDHSGKSPPSNDRLKRELVLRYATYLEQQHKFAEAEKLLVDHNLIELAAKMHMDNDHHAEAIRVIEQQLELLAASDNGGADTEPEVDRQQHRSQQLVELLNATLVECARRIVNDLSAAFRRTGIAGGDLHSSAQSEKLQMAQQMFLRAQRPELAIEMYQSLEMWREAIQVAQRFAPRLLEGVERALDQQVQADIEPILRQTQAASSAPAEAASSSGGDTESLGSSAASAGDQPVRPAADASRNNSTARATPVKGSAAGGKASAMGVWRQFEFAYRQDDRRGARLHFDKYLSLLLANVESYLTTGSAKTAAVSGGNQVARQLRHLDKFLRTCRLRIRAGESVGGTQTVDATEAKSSLIGSILRQRDTLAKIKSLAELICKLDVGWCSMDMSCITQAHATWSSLRNILTYCTHLLAITRGEPVEVEGAQRVRECLLVAHYVTLYVSLVHHLSETQSLERLTIKQVEVMPGSGGESGEPARDLLSKLSFALLRHTHLLDLTHVLHLAGLWQLASGHLMLTRQLWAALLEWHDSRRGGGGSSSSESAPYVNGNRSRKGVSSMVNTPRLPASTVLGQFVSNLPANFTPVLSPVPPGAGLESLNYIRRWLLETLIGKTTSGNDSGANGPPAWAHLNANSLACLACGLPVGPPGPSSLHLSAQVALRAQEFEELLNLCGDAQSDPDGDSVSPPTIRRLEDAIERRQRRRLRNTDGPRNASSSFSPLARSSASAATDQLSEVVDFIMDLSEVLDSSGGGGGEVSS